MGSLTCGAACETLQLALKMLQLGCGLARDVIRCVPVQLQSLLLQSRAILGRPRLILGSNYIYPIGDGFYTPRSRFGGWASGGKDNLRPR